MLKYVITDKLFMLYYTIIYYKGHTSDRIRRIKLFFEASTNVQKRNLLKIQTNNEIFGSRQKCKNGQS